MYVLIGDGEIIAAFALWNDDNGAKFVDWEETNSKSLYFGRFGVNVERRRQGIGSKMSEKAIELVSKMGSEYLWLFAVDKNLPAIDFYIKNGFIQRNEMYSEVIDEFTVLNQFGFEKKEEKGL